MRVRRDINHLRIPPRFAKPEDGGDVHVDGIAQTGMREFFLNRKTTIENKFNRKATGRRASGLTLVRHPLGAQGQDLWA